MTPRAWSKKCALSCSFSSAAVAGEASGLLDLVVEEVDRIPGREGHP